MSSNKTYTLSISRGDGPVVLNVAGRIDSSNAWDFDRTIQGLLRGSDMKLVMDCGKLRYISSAGLRVILTLARRFKPPKKFALTSLSQDIAEILRISGFDQIIAIYDNSEEAAAAL